MNADRMVKAILTLKGWNQGQLAERLGVTQPTVNRWLAGSEPKAAHMDAIRGLYSELSGAPITGKPVTLSEPASGIPNLRIRAGMGGGGLEQIVVREDGQPLPEYTDGRWTLPDGVMARIGAVKGFYAVPVVGDSMAPTIPGGSIAFVDTKHRTPSPQGIYAIDYGDGLLVKRVELIGGTDKIAVLSDNPQYRDYEFARDDVTVWGRVSALFSWTD